MKKYEIDRIRRCGLYKLMEKRRVKGKWVWVCVGIITGARNADRLETKLNKG